MINLSPQIFQEAKARVAPHVYHTPLLTSRLLSEKSGFDIQRKTDGSVFDLRMGFARAPR